MSYYIQLDQSVEQTSRVLGNPIDFHSLVANKAVLQNHRSESVTGLVNRMSEMQEEVCLLTLLNIRAVWKLRQSPDHCSIMC